MKLGRFIHQCSVCGGTGAVDMTGIYRETLEQVEWITKRKMDCYVVANRDAAKFGCSPTALNNRLARLEQLGYLFSENYGRQRRFFLSRAQA